MPRKFNLAVLLGLITVSVLSFSLTAGAQSEETGTTDEVAEAQETLAQMRIDQEKAAEEYNTAASTLQGLNGDITNTTRDLEAAENRLAEAEAKLASQAGEIYKQGNVAFADILLDSKSASDFTTRLNLVARLLITERDEVAQLRAAMEELEAEAERRQQQVQNHEQTAAEMEARWEKARTLETEMEAYLGSLNEAVLAEIEAERERQTAAAEEEAQSLLAAQLQTADTESAPDLAAEQAKLAAEKSAAEQMEAEQAAREDAAKQAAAAEEAKKALEQAQTEQEQREAQAAAEEAQAAAEEAEKKAQEEASRAAAAEQAKEEASRAAANEQAKKQAIRAAADEQATLMAEQREIEQKAKEDAAKQAIAAENAKKAAEAAQTAQERQQAQAAAQEAEAAAREQANKAAEAEQAKQNAEKALAEEQKKTQPAGAQPTPPQPTPPTNAQPTPPTNAQPTPNPPAATPPVSGGGGADVIAEGRKAQGVPYVLGGQDLSGMDCTGFTMWAYRGIVALPDSIEGQAASGPVVSGPPQAGDILVWPGYHIAMATGPDTMIHASNYHMKVIEVPISDMEPYAFAVRPTR